MAEVRMVNDSDDSCCFLRGFAEVDLWVCSTKSQKIEGKTVF